MVFQMLQVRNVYFFFFNFRGWCYGFIPAQETFTLTLYVDSWRCSQRYWFWTQMCNCSSSWQTCFVCWCCYSKIPSTQWFLKNRNLLKKFLELEGLQLRFWQIEIWQVSHEDRILPPQKSHHSNESPILRGHSLSSHGRWSEGQRGLQISSKSLYKVLAHSWGWDCCDLKNSWKISICS